MDDARVMAASTAITRASPKRSPGAWRPRSHGRPGHLVEGDDIGGRAGVLWLSVSQVFKSDRARPALIADGLAECQIRWPEVAIVFCETRQLAEAWTCRYAEPPLLDAPARPVADG